MASIFISHSGKDKDLVEFFASAFATTKVKAVFEEFERILKGTPSASTISKNIEYSNAVFVILSGNVSNVPHTRDWVAWETGVGKNKDVWVFESYEEYGSVSVVTPFLRHYVVYAKNESFFKYIVRIIESYDDSNLLPAVAISTTIGALLGRGGGAAVGAIAGVMMSDKSRERPVGIGRQCSNCKSSYNLHIPQGMKFIRCPVCNKVLEIR